MSVLAPTLAASPVAAEGRAFLRTQAVSINALVGELGQVGSEALVVILDSCRKAPSPDQTASGTGLALVDAPPNAIIACLTAPAAVALDGSGANSPFTAALASTLVGTEQDFRNVQRLVRVQVRRAPGGAQSPWFIDNSPGEIRIGPTPALSLDPALALADTAEGTRGLAAPAWRTIAQGGDPRDFAASVEVFPGTPLAELACKATITQCDILASAPGDVMAPVEGLPHDLVNARTALRACGSAVADDPERPSDRTSRPCAAGRGTP